jgi:hypothetical protein
MIQRLLFIVILIMAVSGCALRHCTPDGAMAVGRNDAALWHGDKPGLARAADCTRDFSPLAFEDHYRAGFQRKLEYECTTAAAASQGARHGASGRLLDENFAARWGLCEEVGVSQQVMSGAYRASYQSRYCDPSRFEALGKAQPERFTPLTPVLLDPCPPDVRKSLEGTYKAGYQSRYCISSYFAARGASMGEALFEPQSPPLDHCPPKKRDTLRQSYEAAYDAGFNYACSPVSATIKGEEDGQQRAPQTTQLARYRWCPDHLQAGLVQSYRQAYDLVRQQQERERRHQLLQERLEEDRRARERQERAVRVKASRAKFTFKGHHFSTTCETRPGYKDALVIVSHRNGGRIDLDGEWRISFMDGVGHMLGARWFNLDLTFRGSGVEELTVSSRAIPTYAEICRAVFIGPASSRRRGRH